MIGVNDNMPIGAMNIGELKTLLIEILQDNLGNPTSRSNATAAPKRYVHGIKGIEELFRMIIECCYGHPCLLEKDLEIMFLP